MFNLNVFAAATMLTASSLISASNEECTAAKATHDACKTNAAGTSTEKWIACCPNSLDWIAACESGDDYFSAANWWTEQCSTCSKDFSTMSDCWVATDSDGDPETVRACCGTDDSVASKWLDLKSACDGVIDIQGVGIKNNLNAFETKCTSLSASSTKLETFFWFYTTMAFGVSIMSSI